MTDPARQFIDDTMTQLGVWRPDLVGRYKVGRKHWQSQENAPFIWWAYGPINHDAADKLGGDTKKQINTELQTLWVKLWLDGTDPEEICRTAKNDLLRALRIQGSGPIVTIGAFDWVSDDEIRAGHATNGAILQGSITVRLPIISDPSTLPTPIATVTGAEITVTAGLPSGDEVEQTIIIPAP